MTTSAPRLSFLDALRGLAALAVAVAHRAESTFDGYLRFDHEVFRLGQFGVVAFFLCSGFIIPASLERHESLARFWKGRFFRLYPLYWAVLAAVLLLAAAGIGTLGPGYPDRWLANTLLNTTMAQALIGAPLALGLSWTLGYELGFYALMSLLFLLGLHRRSRTLAAGWAGLALGLGLLDAGLPAVAVPLLALILLPTPFLVRREHRRTTLAALAAVAAAMLLNRHGEAWLNAAFLAAMFTGTVLYRHATGALPAAAAAWTYAGAAIAISTAVELNAPYPASGRSFAAAFGLFALAYGLRRLTFPRPLVLLGTISYSVYLLHPVVFALIPNTESLPAAGFALALAATVLAAALTYRCIERPMIARGRHPTRSPRRPAPDPLPTTSETPPHDGAAPRARKAGIQRD